MTSVLLDTHAWAWSLTWDDRLSLRAMDLIQAAEHVFVSPISFFEIGQKVRIGKWPAMQPFCATLPALLAEQGGNVAGLSPDIFLAAATLDWEHRDPFDRLLAATAMAEHLVLISSDVIFDGLAGQGGWISRVW